MSIAMIRKLLPVCGTPNRSPADVPLTSPCTMTRSPATRTSLISNFMSGIALAKPPTTLIKPRYARREIRGDDGRQVLLKPKWAAIIPDGDEGDPRRRQSMKPKGISRALGALRAPEAG